MTITVTLYRRGAIKRRPDGSRYGSIEFHVRSDDVNQDQDAILNDSGIPQPLVTAHPDNASMICRETEVDEYDGSDLSWIVTANYDSQRVPDQQQPDASTTPVKGGIVAYTEQRPVWWDAFGNPLVNDAGDYFEGQTKRHRLRRYPVTANFAAVPDAIFNLAGTVNNAAITIHGRTYPAGVALLGDVTMPDEPSLDANDVLYWPVSYDVIIDPDGWTTVLPNRGFMCLSYETRADTSSAWEEVGYDAYAAESNSDLKRVRKVRIIDDADADVPQNLWLNNHGEKILASFSAIDTTGTVAAGSDQLTVASATNAEVGKYIVITEAGPEGRNLRARITAVAGSILTIEPAAYTAITSKAVKGGGVFCKVFWIDDLADWSGLPLPNNHT